MVCLVMFDNVGMKMFLIVDSVALLVLRELEFICLYIVGCIV